MAENTIKLQEIVEAVRTTYANCSYYRDKGTTNSFFGGGKHCLVFETEYKNPENLVLKTYKEGEKDEENMTVFSVSEGLVKKRYSKSTIDFIKASEERFKFVAFLNSLFPKATFHSSELEKQAKGRPLDSASLFGLCDYKTNENVVYLLMPGHCKNWTEERLLQLSDKIINGIDCYHIRCVYKPVQFWISKDDFLIRKVRTDINDFWHHAIMHNGSELALRFFGSELRNSNSKMERRLKKYINNPDYYTIGEFEEIEIG